MDSITQYGTTILHFFFQFRRATVQNQKTGDLETATYRISKSGWLGDPEHIVVETVGKRITDMTGLTMRSAEELQVVNYGIGGHYEPHYDFARKEEQNAFKNLGTGNRIATTLFYVCDTRCPKAKTLPTNRLIIRIILFCFVCLSNLLLSNAYR